VDSTVQVLLTTAIGVGFIHTLIGVDHTLPFVVLARARGWSLQRTLMLTTICGLGHVLSSVFLGTLGLSLGVALTRLEWIEATRGEFAAWMLIVFGSVYTVWSIARRRREHRHTHEHHDGVVHTHRDGRSSHRHSNLPPASMTAWGLFVVFVLGPCEPLIPLLMVPALNTGMAAVIAVATVFGVVTIGTMLTVVALGYAGLNLPAFRRFEPFAHTLAGLAIVASGVAIRALGI
jgi:sulfite exporter TauE/SafE